MTRRSVKWGVGAALYAVINVGGAIYAFAMGELAHGTLHVVLLVVGVAIWARYGPRREMDATPPGASRDRAPDDLAGRFRNLEQSIDAVAIEVERIGEGQRAMTNLLVDRDATPAPGGEASQPTKVDRGRSPS